MNVTSLFKEISFSVEEASKLAQLVMLPTCVREGHSSNLGQDDDYHG
jgi:hypothetical protein